MKLIDKDTVVAEIKKRCKEAEFEIQCATYRQILSFLNTLEVKDVVAEQKGICYGIFNRIIGNNWNLSIPLDKVGLKHGDKVKIFVTKENT